MPTKTQQIVESGAFPKNARFLQFDEELRRGEDDFGYVLIGPVEAFLLKPDLFPEYKDINLDAGGLCSKYLLSLSQSGMDVFTNPTHYNSEKMVIIRHRDCVPGKVEAITALVMSRHNQGSDKYDGGVNFTPLDCKHGGCTKESANGKGGYCAAHVPKVSWPLVVLACFNLSIVALIIVFFLEMHRFTGARAVQNQQMQKQ